jgi:Glycosyl hydrolases family 39
MQRYDAPARGPGRAPRVKVIALHMSSTRPRRRTLLLAVLGVLALAPAAHAAAPGVNVNGVPTAQNTDDVIASGSKYARFFVLWSDVEATRGVFDNVLMASYQDQFARLNAAGVRPVLVVMGAPSWANGSSDRFVPPRSAAEFGAFTGALASRLRGKVAAYEVWNEPDEAAFWHGSAPDVAKYTALLKAAHSAIKAADPSTLVIAGPTTGNNYDWIDGLYNNGAKGSFDAIAVHTDTACLDRGPDFFYREGGRIGQYSFLGYQTVHGVMAAHGDGNTPIWMTELGWSSTNKTCSRGQWAGQKPAGVGEANQAVYLKQAYHCLALDPYVAVAMWFNLQDLVPADDELNRYGLLRFDRSQKPAWGAFRDVAVNGDQLTGQCAKLDGPAITVAAPTDGGVYADGLYMKASASDPRLHSISFSVDGKKITGFSGAKIAGGRFVSMLWHGAGKLSYGPHTVTVRASDDIGNTSTQDVTVTRVHRGDVSTLQKVRIKVKVRGKGLRRRVTGRVIAPTPPGGRVHVMFQVKTKHKWRTRHLVSKNANHSFRVTQRLARPGKWRVRVRYMGAGLFRAKTASSKAFAAR